MGKRKPITIKRNQPQRINGTFTSQWCIEEMAINIDSPQELMESLTTK